MNAKQIAERLRELSKGPRAVFGDDVLDALAKAADLLERIAWVPVSEPPESGRSYWVSYQFGQMEAWFIDCVWYARCPDFVPIKTVTHWMPLPNPPSE